MIFLHYTKYEDPRLQRTRLPQKTTIRTRRRKPYSPRHQKSRRKTPDRRKIHSKRTRRLPMRRKIQQLRQRNNPKMYRPRNPSRSRQESPKPQNHRTIPARQKQAKKPDQRKQQIRHLRTDRIRPRKPRRIKKSASETFIHPHSSSFICPKLRDSA